jgi:hypothetical protein
MALIAHQKLRIARLEVTIRRRPPAVYAEWLRRSGASWASRLTCPGRQTDSGAVTLESEIADFLCRRRGRLFCDECLRRLLHKSNLPRVADAADSVGTTTGFQRLDGMCANCGGSRTGTKAG